MLNAYMQRFLFYIRFSYYKNADIILCKFPMLKAHPGKSLHEMPDLLFTINGQIHWMSIRVC